MWALIAFSEERIFLGAVFGLLFGILVWLYAIGWVVAAIFLLWANIYMIGKAIFRRKAYRSVEYPLQQEGIVDWMREGF
jgi:O-antigen/teichoic acid export membrane protein